MSIDYRWQLGSKTLKQTVACFGNVSSSGTYMVHNWKNNNPTKKVPPLKFIIDLEKTAGKYLTRHKTTEERDIIDKAWMDVGFSKWARGLYRKEYSKDGTVKTITFSPNTPYYLIISATWFYFTSSTQSNHFTIYKVLVDAGVLPLIAHFASYNIHNIINRDSIQLANNTGHLAWGASGLTTKAIKRIRNLEPKDFNKLTTVTTGLKNLPSFTYMGRDKFWYQNSQYGGWENVALSKLKGLKVSKPNNGYRGSFCQHDNLIETLHKFEEETR